MLTLRTNEDMLEDYEKKRQKQVSSIRSIFDFGVGLLFCCIGGVLFFKEKLNIEVNENFSSGTLKILGVVFFLYGIWRIYSGYKKKYSK